MKADRQKLLLAMANTCINAYELCKKAEIQYQTYRRVVNGGNSKPATLGKIAKALGVDVSELLKIEKGETL